MGLFDFDFSGLGTAIGSVARRIKFASWKGAKSPYGLPVPICIGVTWVDAIQIYSGEPFTWFVGTGGPAAMHVPVYTVDDATGEVSIEEQGETCQSAVLVLAEHVTTILDILKNGVSINTGMLDDTEITTVTQRLRMISGRIPDPAGVIPPSGEDHGYFWPGLPGTATAHTRFSRTANLGAAPYTYSTVAHVALCALGIGSRESRPSLKFKVQGELAASATVGAHPADVLLYLWELAGKDPDDLDVESYYRDYVTGGGGSGSTAWRVNRTIDTQTPARELIEALLFETFSTVIKKEDGTLIVVPRDVAVGGATALGVNDFVKGAGPLITVEMKQASDLFNCYPVIYEVTTASGTHQVTNEDTTWAVAHPFSATETIRRAPPVRATWISTAEHALNLSYLLARENCTVRGTYKFRLHKRWVLLQEHDLLSLTEPHLGASAKAVKILRTSEDSNGVIEVEADEWLGQVSYTTPEVDPFDGFGGTLPGNPKDPTDAAIDAMADDGKITPAEKKDLYNAIVAIWHKYGEIGITFSTYGDDYPLDGGALGAAGLAFYNYLDDIGFTWAWSDIDANWPDAGDRTTQRALLAAWMAVTTDVVADDFRGAFVAINAALGVARGSEFSAIMAPVATGSTTARTLTERLAEAGNVLDHGADPTGATDSTAAFMAAQALAQASSSSVKRVRIPAGRYKVTNVYALTPNPSAGFGTLWEGDGYSQTIIEQGDPDEYAFSFISTFTAGVGTPDAGQLLGCGLVDLKIVGAADATVPAVYLEAMGAGAITHSRFDYYAEDTYGALKIHCTDAGAVYNCDFRVVSNLTSGRAIDIDAGTYNTYDFFLTGCSDYAIYDMSWDSHFLRVITDGAHHYAGQNNQISKPVIENVYADEMPGDVGIYLAGFNNTLFRPTLSNVPAAKCSVAFNVAASCNSILGIRIVGPGWPTYSLTLAAGSSGTIMDAVVPNGPAWAASTAYSQDQLVVNDSGKLYSCITAGTSAGSGGPTGTASDITDGTAHWRYDGVAIARISMTSELEAAWSFVGNTAGIRTPMTLPTPRNIQYVQPSSGGTTTCNDEVEILVLVTGGSGGSPLATHAVTLPAAPMDGQVLRIVNNVGITALTVSPSGTQSLLGPAQPMTLATNTGTGWVYHAASNAWWVL